MPVKAADLGALRAGLMADVIRIAEAIVRMLTEKGLG